MLKPLEKLGELYKQLCESILKKDKEGLEIFVSSESIAEPNPLFVRVRRLNSFANGYRTNCHSFSNPYYDTNFTKKSSFKII